MKHELLKNVVPSKDEEIIGTFRLGKLNVDYATLVKLFGKPNGEGDNIKVDVEWVLKTPSGVATIYNYKDGKVYLGEKGLAVEDIIEWHVGGYDKEVLQYFKYFLVN